MKKILLILALSYGYLFASFYLDESEIESYKARCEARDKDACSKLGSHYSNTFSASGYTDLVAKELNLKYFMRACNDLREGGSCTSLGSYYAIVEKDKNKEFEFYEKACSYGDAGGCYLLASKLEREANNASGKDKKELIRKSKQFYKKACNLGHKPACG
ncbi:hypothetical protein CCY99_06020 [Helicobacter sp. 16-1353]|uniref:sel1 repeat family protein n=1 Tax=Helicobacter sp. 16-1353 TaxID=2004996 RepID=UPI000DCCAA6D|nr:sel1 repeat family protein [Helicobacter sp. 16-1353]RAX53146.1 hypothetical protein CCY99_06020 [Helicobacter sp. 16-1353]